MTEQELVDKLFPNTNILALVPMYVGDFRKMLQAYAAAQMAEKEAEIARLVSSSKLKSDLVSKHLSDKISLRKEIVRLKAENERLQAILSPAPEKQEDNPAPSIVWEGKTLFVNDYSMGYFKSPNYFVYGRSLGLGWPDADESDESQRRRKAEEMAIKWYNDHKDELV